MFKTINLSGKIKSLQNPLIMGIINITPDSFHKDSRFNPFAENFLAKAKEMIENGADILDIGGFSTRPDAKYISEKEECERILPAIESLRKISPHIPISIDTFRSKVADMAINSGATMINDVSGGNLDKNMFNILLKHQVPYILMHMRGDPNTMQTLSNYKNLHLEILKEVFEKANFLKKIGLKDIIIDPGFGFAKTLEQNYEILKNIEIYNQFDYPTLIGLSRKSMIYKKLDKGPDEALLGTCLLNFWAEQKKCNIIRVHDIKEAFETRLFLNQIQNQ